MAPFLLAACGPTTEAERAYVQAREAERLEREEMRRTLVAAIQDDEVLKMVQEKESPDGAGTMMDWLGRELQGLKGQTLFPRWQVTRRGSMKYDVRYTYTWIDPSERISTRGWMWTVDGGLRLVGEPHELAPVDTSPRARTISRQQGDRIRSAERSLE